VVPVEGEVAQIVDVQAQLAAVDGLADQRQLQTGEVVGEDRDDVDGHLRTSRLGAGRVTGPRLGGGAIAALGVLLGHRTAVHSASRRPAGGVTARRPASMSTSGTISVTNGMSTSCPRVCFICSRSCATPLVTSTISPTSASSS